MDVIINRGVDEARAGSHPLFSLAALVSFVFLVSLSILLTAPAHAQTAGASFSVDTALVGERFTLTLSVATPRGRRAVFPDPAPGDTIFGDLFVIGVGDTMPGDAGITRVEYEVTTFSLDSAVTPPLPIRLIGERDTLLLQTPGLVLPVGSVVPDTATTVRDLAPIFPFERPLWPWIMLGMGILGLAAIIALLFWKRSLREEDETAAAPRRTPETPRREALRRLREIEAQYNPGDADQVKTFYVQLSDTLRKYLHRRIHVPALETTTAELAELLRRHPRMPGGAPGQIRSILVLADLAKFADFQPSESEGRQALRETYSLVDRIEEHLRPETEPNLESA